jgi:hypothetical protein
MPDVFLKVPLVGQKTGYDGQPLVQPSNLGITQHGFMACWYAAACMVSYYYRPGPRLGLPKTWQADKGLTLTAVNSLAAVEGLKIIFKPVVGLTCDTIANLLQIHGPIWAAGHYFDGNPSASHAIVITGVQSNLIFYNDPWEPKEKKKSVEWIDKNILRISHALMVKDRAKY